MFAPSTPMGVTTNASVKSTSEKKKSIPRGTSTSDKTALSKASSVKTSPCGSLKIAVSPPSPEGSLNVTATRPFVSSLEEPVAHKNVEGELPELIRRRAERSPERTDTAQSRIDLAPAPFPARVSENAESTSYLGLTPTTSNP